MAIVDNEEEEGTLTVISHTYMNLFQGAVTNWITLVVHPSRFIAERRRRI